ncbi:MAG: AMP-binding protein [Gammaproteobacteria bacterium]|nr:AMP-binding protein [Gammaproteobacteria bacterium]
MSQHNLYLAYAEHFPSADAEFLRTETGHCETYGDLDLRSAQMAHCLLQQGLKAGDRVTVQCEKSPEFIHLYLACLRAGLVFHPLNPGYPAAEVEYFVQDAAPGLILGDASTLEGLASAASRHGKARVMELEGLADASRNAPETFATVACQPDALAALLYSSGTTGKPKGIMLSHHNLAFNARALSKAWGFTHEDVLLHLLPLFHVHGLFIALGCILMSGSRMLFGTKFEVARALAWLPEATVMMGVPTYYTRLLGSPDLNRDLVQGIRLFTSGSAPLLAETWHAFRERTGHEVLERYGMTETSIIATNPLQGERRPGSVGPALEGVEIRIVDDAETVLPVGTTGHVQVRGDSVFKGYWGMSEKTRADILPEGWFRTGDDGVLDARGYLTLVGRAKDLIITGGLNVYPSEVETVLDEVPGVLESAVIGLPHEDFGEQVVGVVVLKPGASWDEQAARNHLRAQLAAFKCPKLYRVVQELPRNAMGKVQKNLLRDTHSN